MNRHPDAFERVSMSMTDLLSANSQPYAPSDICIIGIGNAGNRALGRMLSDDDFDYATFVSIDTEENFKKTDQLKTFILPGIKSFDDEFHDIHKPLRKIIRHHSLIFLLNSEGGTTGTAVAPLVAKLAHSVGKRVIAIVCRPGEYEGEKRARIANDGITQLRHEADGTIVIPNGRLISRQTDLQHQSFEASDLALVEVVRSLSDAATSFNTYSVFEKSITGYPILLFGIGCAEGHKSAKQAAKLALTSPLLDDSLDGIQRILIIITGRVTDEEKNTVKHIVKKAVGSSVHVKCKQMFDDSLGKEIQVAILASQK